MHMHIYYICKYINTYIVIYIYIHKSERVQFDFTMLQGQARPHWTRCPSAKLHRCAPPVVVQLAICRQCNPRHGKHPESMAILGS